MDVLIFDYTFKNEPCKMLSANMIVYGQKNCCIYLYKHGLDMGTMQNGLAVAVEFNYMNK